MRSRRYNRRLAPACTLTPRRFLIIPEAAAPEPRNSVMRVESFRHDAGYFIPRCTKGPRARSEMNTGRRDVARGRVVAISRVRFSTVPAIACDRVRSRKSVASPFGGAPAHLSPPPANDGIAGHEHLQYDPYTLCKSWKAIRSLTKPHVHVRHVYVESLRVSRPEPLESRPRRRPKKPLTNGKPCSQARRQ